MPKYAEEWATALNVYGTPAAINADAFARVSAALTARLAVDPEGKGDVAVNAADLTQVLSWLLAEVSGLESQIQYGDEYR